MGLGPAPTHLFGGRGWGVRGAAPARPASSPTQSRTHSGSGRAGSACSTVGGPDRREGPLPAGSSILSQCSHREVGALPAASEGPSWLQGAPRSPSSLCTVDSASCGSGRNCTCGQSLTHTHTQCGTLVPPPGPLRRCQDGARPECPSSPQGGEEPGLRRAWSPKGGDPPTPRMLPLRAPPETPEPGWGSGAAWRPWFSGPRGPASGAGGGVSGGSGGNP